MAKKILYKIKAYHCPRCGSPTEPTKKYCDYCSRDLAIRNKDHNKNKFRILIDCGNYVFFDSLKNIEIIETPSIIDVTMLEDVTRRFLHGTPESRIVMDFAFSERSAELMKLGYQGLHKIRLEHLGLDTSYEQECYIANSVAEIFRLEMVYQRIELIGVGNRITGTAIPKEIMDGFRCPNCGAPVTSRYGACEYCSGWSEIEF